MDIISGLLSDEDVQYMSDSLILAYGDILDDVLASMFKSYLENQNAEPQVRERIKNLIGDHIRMRTFHEEVIKNGTRDIVSSLSLETLAYTQCDYDLIINTMNWINENRQYMRQTIDPRSRESFETLKSEASKYDKAVASNGYTVVYPNMLGRIQANKNLFYSPNEKQKGTRIGNVIRKVQESKIALQGAQYLKYCAEHNITGWRVSEF